MLKFKTLLKALLVFKKKKREADEKLKENEVEKNKLKVFIGTWNMHGKLPPHDLEPFLEAIKNDKFSSISRQQRPYLDRTTHHPYHLIVIGTQECEHNIGHSVFFPSKAEWELRLKNYLGSQYTLVKTETLAALHLAVFVLNGCKDWIRGYRHASVSTGIANLFGNKGAVGISLLFGDTSFLFINSHLAAHQTKLKQRNNNVKKISEELKLKGFRKTDKARKNVTDRFDYVFWLGDMNYRVNLTRSEADQLIKDNNISDLLAHDQLTKELKTNSLFKNFNEAAITFMPTFKFDVTHSSHQHHASTVPRSYSSPSILQSAPLLYDTSEKQRVPSWTDRIIWKTRLPTGKDAITVESYTSHTNVSGFSDHRPVTGCFLVDYDWEKIDFLDEIDSPHPKLGRPLSIASTESFE